MALDISDMLSKNVILVDSNYIDTVAFDFSTNFERLLNRSIPKADFALWLDCIALDGGIEPGNNDIQVIIIYNNEELKSFTPSDIKTDIDGKAFKDNLGEFTMEAYPVAQDVATLSDQFSETLRVLLDAESVENLLIVPNMQEYCAKVMDILNKNEKKKVTLFSIQPQEGTSFQLQQLGFSIVHALGIKGEELR